MAADVHALQKEVAALRHRLGELERLFKKQWARIASPTPGGPQIRFAELVEDLASGGHADAKILYTDNIVEVREMMGFYGNPIEAGRRIWIAHGYWDHDAAVKEWGVVNAPGDPGCQPGTEGEDCGCDEGEEAEE